MKNSSPCIGKNFIIQFHGKKMRLWQKTVVFLLIEFLFLGQTPFVLAQPQEASDQPVEQQLELPPGAQEVLGGNQQVEESPFMPVGAPAFDVGHESPFFDSDNDTVPGSGQEDTGYALEDIVSIDDTLRMDLSDKSQMPRYKLRFTLTDATSFFNTGFEDISLKEKENGGYLYSEKLLSVMTKNGHLELAYTYYINDDGYEDGGIMSDNVVENYELGVEYTAEFQITLTSIRVYVYKTSEGIGDEPDFVIESIDAPVFYATTKDNPDGNLSLEILKKLDTGYEPVDLDNDGVIDAYYDSSTGLWGIDIDGDGIPDGIGIDTDEDGIPDQFRFDQDRDGIADGNAIDFDIDFEGGGFNVQVPRTDKTIIRADGTLDIYDNDGNLIGSYDTQGTSTSYDYLPGGGRRITSTDSQGNVTIQVFDENDRLITQTVKLKIDGVLQEPGNRTGFLYENDGDPSNPGGEIRSQYTDENGNGVKDSEDSFITRAVLNSNNQLLSLTSFDAPKEGDLTIQRFNENGNISSITIDESVEHGDGFTIQEFDINGNIMNATIHNGLTGDEIIQRFSPNGRIIEQTDNDGDTHELTYHYFSYKTDPVNIGWQIRTERINNPNVGRIKSIARIDSNNSLVNTSIFSDDDPNFMETFIEYNTPQEDYTTYHSYEQDGSENKLIYNDLNQMKLQQSLDNEGTVQESILYEYETIGAQNFRKGYIDSNKDGVLDPEETLFNSIAELDNYGDIINVTSYDDDGVTPVSVTEINKPNYGWSTYRQLNEPEGKATIQIIDHQSQLRAMMTLDSPWANYEDSDHVEESTVFEYDSGYRWGYRDDNKNGQRDTGENHIRSVAQFDNDGNFISITTYKEDGSTISTVVEFNWPAEDYTATRILDEDGDMVQISDPDGNLSAMMTLKETWGDYKDPMQVASSTVFVYDGSYRWGYVDSDCDAVKDATETKLNSVAEFDNEGNYISITSYDEDGVTINTVTEFNWPLEDYTVTRLINEPAGKSTIQISDDEGRLYCMMTMSSQWADYKDPSLVDESVLYEYNDIGNNTQRVGYVDEDNDAIRDAGEDKLDSIMIYDNEGSIISITGYLVDGVTMQYIATYDVPQEDWNTQRMINQPFTRDTITIFDNEGKVRATQTTEGTLADPESAYDVIKESTVYVYEDTVRWGYVDTDKNGLYDSDNDDILENKVQYDVNGKVLSATYFSYDEVTMQTSVSRVDVYNYEFNTPREGYVTTYLYDYPSDDDMVKQVSNPDGNLEKKHEYDNDSDTWTYIVYHYPNNTERYGYIDHDCDGGYSAGDQLESLARFDENGNLSSVTDYFRSGTYQGDISRITTYYTNGTMSVRINRAPESGAADGDYLIYYYDRNGKLYRLDHHDISEDRIFEDYYSPAGFRYLRITRIRSTNEIISEQYFNTTTLPDGRTRVVDPETGLISVYNVDGSLGETTDNQKVVTIYYYDNDGYYVREDNLGYMTVWYGDPTDPGTSYTTYYNALNSITTYEFTLPLGRGSDWEMIEMEYWADGLVIERNYETQDIISISKYVRDGSNDLVSETIIYQNKLKMTTEMNWPLTDWRAVHVPGLGENDNDAVFIVDQANKLRGYMEIKKNSNIYKYKDPANIILSVVYDYDTQGNMVGYVDTDKDGIWDEGVETTLYSYTEEWSQDSTKEVTRIYNASGDTIIIRDATFNGKKRAKMVLTGTGIDYNVPANVSTSELYLYDNDGSWNIYTDVNKNGVYDSGIDTDTGYDGSPNYRSHNGGLIQSLDNEGNILSNTFGNGYMIDYLVDSEGNSIGTRESRYYGTFFNYDNEGNPYPKDIQDYVGNWISVDPTNGSYKKYYKEFETSGANEGEYVGTIAEYSGGYLISLTDNEGRISEKTYTNSNIKFKLLNNGDAVNIYQAGSDTIIAAQILQYGEYREYHSNGMASSILKYNSGDGTFVKRYNSSGGLISLTYVDGSFYGADTNGTYHHYSEMTSPYFHIDCNDGNQYVFRTGEYSNIVQNVTTGGTVVPITDNGTTPTNTISYSTVYYWTEDSGSTHVYRFNGINRYFSGGVLQKTTWTDSSGNLVREIVYDSINVDGTVVIESITDGTGASMTINRTSGTVTGYDFTMSDGADIEMASNGQVTKITRNGHIQNYSTSGMITSITTGDNTVQTRDSAGNVTSITDADGTTATYYRSSGNLVSIVIEDASLGQERLYEMFSGHLRLSSVTEDSGRLTEYYYDSNGYLIEYDDASPVYAIIITEGDTTYRYGYHPDSAIPGSYLYNVTKTGIYQLTYTRLQAAPYYVLSQQLQLYGPYISGTHHDLYLVFFGSSWKTGGNYDYGNLNYITGTRFGVQYAIKNP